MSIASSMYFAESFASESVYAWLNLSPTTRVMMMSSPCSSDAMLSPVVLPADVR